MCNSVDDMVHVSWMVYRLLGQWSCSSGVYHEPYAKGISQRNVYIYELFDCCDKLGLYSGILVAVSDAEEDASRWRTSYQQGLLLCIAGSGDGSDYAGNVCI